MKLGVIFMIFMASVSQATAETVNCLIKETGSQTRETKVQHNYNKASAHDFTLFDTAFATGFVAMNDGYGVVNIVSKEKDQTFSFYGKLGDGTRLGGNAFLGKTGDDWFKIECQ